MIALSEVRTHPTKLHDAKMSYKDNATYDNFYLGYNLAFSKHRNAFSVSSYNILNNSVGFSINSSLISPYAFGDRSLGIPLYDELVKRILYCAFSSFHTSDRT